MMLEFKYYKTMTEIRQHVKNCEGIHVQQVAYSSYHDTLTQICFDCGLVRSNLKVEKK